MSKHTSGPWVVNYNSLGEAHIESEHEHGWANNGWIIAKAYGDDPERHANAHLIAAAPDLLAACKSAVLNPHLSINVEKALRKAIAKAEENNE